MIIYPPHTQNQIVDSILVQKTDYDQLNNLILLRNPLRLYTKIIQYLLEVESVYISPIRFIFSRFKEYLDKDEIILTLNECKTFEINYLINRDNESGIWNIDVPADFSGNFKSNPIQLLKDVIWVTAITCYVRQNLHHQTALIFPNGSYDKTGLLQLSENIQTLFDSYFAELSS